MKYPQVVGLVIYVFIVLFCGGLIVLSDKLGPTVQEELIPVASKGLWLALSALVGAASMLIGQGENRK